MKRLGPWDATAVLVGIVVGSGIFLVPSAIARQLGSPGMILAVWLVGGLLSLLGALTYAELGASRPLAGGQYIYLRDAYGSLWGFLFGWVLFLVIQTGSIAAVAVGFAQYVGAFVELGPGAVKAVAVAAILGLSWVNAQSLRFGVGVQNLFCALKMLALLALVVLGLSSGEASWGRLAPFWPESFSLSVFGLSLVGVLWAFDGWNCVSFLSGEVREPQRNLPFALVTGILIVTAGYVLANLAYLVLLGVEGMASAPQDRVASAAAQLFGGAAGAGWIAAGILVSTFGCLNGMIMTSPWVYFAIARDGLFFETVARLHPERKTPVTAIGLQAIWSALLALSGSYDQLFTYVVFVAWLFYGMAVGAVFVFRRREGAPEGYRAWGYPLTPALFVLAAATIVLNTLWTEPGPSLAGLGITLLGVPFYLRQRHHRPG